MDDLSENGSISPSCLLRSESLQMCILKTKPDTYCEKWPDAWLTARAKRDVTELLMQVFGPIFKVNGV